MESVHLEAFRYRVQLGLSPRFANPPAVWLDRTVNLFVLTMEQDVLGERLKVVECSYPVDWWQAFKERWFPAWAQRRWPVRKTRVHLEARALYPMVRIPKEPHVLSLSKVVAMQHSVHFDA